MTIRNTYHWIMSALNNVSLPAAPSLMTVKKYTGNTISQTAMLYGLISLFTNFALLSMSGIIKNDLTSADTHEMSCEGAIKDLTLLIIVKNLLMAGIIPAHLALSVFVDWYCAIDSTTLTQRSINKLSNAATFFSKAYGTLSLLSDTNIYFERSTCPSTAYFDLAQISVGVANVMTLVGTLFANKLKYFDYTPQQENPGNRLIP